MARTTKPLAKTDAWADARDADHPVLWTPASGKDHEASRYATLDEAVRRLTNYGIENARERLLAGATLRTQFAFYELAK